MYKFVTWNKGGDMEHSAMQKAVCLNPESWSCREDARQVSTYDGPSQENAGYTLDVGTMT
jgi:hypothetical protein